MLHGLHSDACLHSSAVSCEGFFHPQGSSDIRKIRHQAHAVALQHLATQTSETAHTLHMAGFIHHIHAEAARELHRSRSCMLLLSLLLG